MAISGEVPASRAYAFAANWTRIDGRSITIVTIPVERLMQRLLSCISAHYLNHGADAVTGRAEAVAIGKQGPCRTSTSAYPAKLAFAIRERNYVTLGSHSFS